MRLKKAMRLYYKHKMENIKHAALIPPPQEFNLEFASAEDRFDWQDVVGWGIVVAIVVHYILSNSFFEVIKVMPSIAYLF